MRNTMNDKDIDEGRITEIEAACYISKHCSEYLVDITAW